jgi:hypothetical protein
MIWKTRHNKRETVRQMMATLTGTPMRTALMMPGEQACCVADAVEAGVIAPSSTQVIAVERDRETFKKMKAAVQGINLSVPPILRKTELHRVRDLPKGIDFAFLDFCGNWDTDTARWADQVLSPCLVAGSTVAITLSCDCRDRANIFIKQIRKAYEDGNHPLTIELQNVFRPYGDFHKMDPKVAIALASCLTVFSGWKTMPVVFYPYQDGKFRMVVIALHLVERMDVPGWPTIDDVLEVTAGIDFGPKIKAGLRSKIMLDYWQKKNAGESLPNADIDDSVQLRRKQAGQKAAATRRANAEKARLNSLKEELHSLLQGRTDKLAEIAEMDRRIGEIYSLLTPE